MQGNTYYDEYSTTKWQNLKKETHTVHTIKYMRIMSFVNSSLFHISNKIPISFWKKHVFKMKHVSIII
jgi:hypothetical protein